MRELLSRLERLFALVQLMRLVEVCEEAAAMGYGEVVIRFQAGKPRFVKVMREEDFSPGQLERKGGEIRGGGDKEIRSGGEKEIRR